MLSGHLFDLICLPKALLFVGIYCFIEKGCLRWYMWLGWWVLFILFVFQLLYCWLMLQSNIYYVVYFCSIQYNGRSCMSAGLGLHQMVCSPIFRRIQQNSSRVYLHCSTPCHQYLHCCIHVLCCILSRLHSYPHVSSSVRWQNLPILNSTCLRFVILSIPFLPTATLEKYNVSLT